MNSLIQKASELYTATFQSTPTHFVLAPGRVNLIGEHTDYHQGLVFPAAIDRTIAIAAAATSGASQFVSEAMGTTGPYDVANLQPGSITSWARYGLGMAWKFAEQGLQPPNIQAVVVSDL